MTACLWQAVPNASAMEVKWALEQSSHLYSQPDSVLGFGIPDLKKAWLYLINLHAPDTELNNKWLVYPNPVKDFIVIEKTGVTDTSNIEVEFFNLNGKLIRTKSFDGQSRLKIESLKDLPSGLFFIRISSAGYSETKKISKISY